MKLGLDIFWKQYFRVLFFVLFWGGPVFAVNIDLNSGAYGGNAQIQNSASVESLHTKMREKIHNKSIQNAEKSKIRKIFNIPFRPQNIVEPIIIKNIKSQTSKLPVREQYSGDLYEITLDEEGLFQVTDEKKKILYRMNLSYFLSNTIDSRSNKQAGAIRSLLVDQPNKYVFIIFENSVRRFNLKSFDMDFESFLGSVDSNPVILESSIHNRSPGHKYLVIQTKNKIIKINTLMPRVSVIYQFDTQNSHEKLSSPPEYLEISDELYVKLRFQSGKNVLISLDTNQEVYESFGVYWSHLNAIQEMHSYQLKHIPQAGSPFDEVFLTQVDESLMGALRRVSLESAPRVEKILPLEIEASIATLGKPILVKDRFGEDMLVFEVILNKSLMESSMEVVGYLYNVNPKNAQVLNRIPIQKAEQGQHLLLTELHDLTEVAAFRTQDQKIYIVNKEKNIVFESNEFEYSFSIHKYLGNSLSEVYVGRIPMQNEAYLESFIFPGISLEAHEDSTLYLNLRTLEFFEFDPIESTQP